jgi:hypothetical protein
MSLENYPQSIKVIKFVINGADDEEVKAKNQRLVNFYNEKIQSYGICTIVSDVQCEERVSSLEKPNMSSDRWMINNKDTGV